MDSAALKQGLVSAVEQHRAVIHQIATSLYDFRETALLEQRSAALLADTLEQSGFTVERGSGGLQTAFSATHGNGRPVIAILAEMDALPDIGHGCGHNLIAAAAVGAALALRHTLPQELATIVVVGTPAEETGTGKIELIKAGIFADVDFAMMVHPSSRRQVVKGSLGLAKVAFNFFGKSAHAAAYPEHGINALDGVLQTFNGINALRQHLRQDVRVHGIITNGGKVPNIVPDEASCYFYIRAEDPAEVSLAVDKVVACARGAALAAGCRLEVDMNERVLAPLKICRSFYELYSRQLQYLDLAEAKAPADRNRGSSDIGNVSQLVPTIHPHVPIGEGLRIHTREFAEATVSARGLAAAVEGAKGLALSAAELALSPHVQEEIRAEFQST